MGNNNMVVHYALIGMCLLTLTGCAVGPDFQRPAPPDVIGYTPSSARSSSNWSREM